MTIQMPRPNCLVNRNYLNGVEWLRFLAAFGIVWFHTEDAPLRSVGYAGLPVFILVFCALIVIHYNEISFTVFSQKRVIRLLVPWLFWSAVFVLANLARSLLSHGQFWEIPPFSAILIGGNIHLWFLPFAFVLSLILYWICRLFINKIAYKSFVMGGSCLLAVTSFYVMSYMSFYSNAPAPFPQWYFAFPCLPLGFLLGYIFREISVENRKMWYVIIFIIMILTLVSLSLTWDSTWLMPYGLALLLTIIVLVFKFPCSSIARQLGTLTYGIYLIHPIIAFFISRIPQLQGPFIVILLTFFVSGGVVYVLRMTRLRVVL